MLSTRLFKLDSRTSTMSHPRLHLQSGWRKVSTHLYRTEYTKKP